MPLLSRALLGLGSILLVHACYSAHEYSSLASLSPSASSPSSPLPSSSRSSTFLPTPQRPSTPTTSSLPLDISLETLFSVLLICIALVLGAEELRPIWWRVWAGGVEHGAQKAPSSSEAGGKGGIGGKGKGGENEGRGTEMGGFEWLEGGRRRGFLDIRGLRREFAGWMREGEREGTKS